jgi:hypothetical protein
MAQLRRWATRAEKRGLVKLVGSLTYRPRALLQASFPAPAAVRIARAHSGKSGLRQRWERALLVLRLRMEPDSYYLLWLHAPERYARAGEFICRRQLRNLLAYIAEGLDPSLRAMITDKARFFELCRRHDIPTPQLLATWRPQGVGFDLGGSTEPVLRRQAEVFFKPMSGMCGTGAGIMRAAADGRWALRIADCPALRLDWRGVAAHFDAMATPMIFQARVSNHAVLARFGSDALHTLRIVTFRQNGEITAQAASLKIAGVRLVTDNFASGGIAAQVDLRSGRLGAGARYGLESPPASLTTVPETGMRFADVVLPFWPETLALACRLHGLLDAYPSLAHDIAITENGPVIVEANENWGGLVLQKAADLGLGRTAFPALIAEHFRQA